MFIFFLGVAGSAILVCASATLVFLGGISGLVTVIIYYQLWVDYW